MPEDANGKAMPRWLYCLTMPPARLPHEGCSWASAMLMMGDERHMFLECPALVDLMQEVSPLFADCSDGMARLVWAKDSAHGQQVHHCLH